MDDTRASNRVSALTERERDILRLLASGLTDSEIAETAVLTVGTVKWYNRQIYSKLGVRNRAQAITTAQRLGLIGHAAAPQSSPRLPTHNLPAQVTSFIGRRHEIGEITQALAESRLVTLTGPPGTGKTRLALEAASEMLAFMRDGVFAVWLAPLQDASLVAHAIAQATGIKAQGRETITEALKRSLQGRQQLLLLDNFEHVIAAAPLVSELLASVHGLRVMATSRELLRLYGETEFPVQPLAVPDLRTPQSGSVPQSEAVELFVQRARAAQPGFALNAENADAVATICVHLDGLPLAIELAAARTRYYAPQTLLMRLGSRLEALDSGPRDVPARQRTLRTTLAWSYDLLDAEEQALFARLGVFAGGCTVDDAAAICGDGLTLDVAGGLESLHGKNLLRLERGTDGEPRFVMLETMREYALDKLAGRGETDMVCERHALHFLVLVQTMAQKTSGPEEIEWVARLEAEHSNLRAALQWSLKMDDPRQLSLHLIAGASRMWEIRGYFSEGYRWLREALALKHNATPTRQRADALHNVAQLTYLQSDYALTRALCEEALAIYSALGDLIEAANTALSLGEVATEVGDYETALSVFWEAEAIMNEHGRSADKARSGTQLGFAMMRNGDLTGATEWLTIGRDRYREAGFVAGEALAISGLGEVALRMGSFAEAESLLEQSLALRRQIMHPWGIAASLGSLAWIAMLQGDHRRAVELLRESLTIRIELSEKGGMAWCVEKLAEIAHIGGDTGGAARLLGAAAALRASVNSVIDPVDQATYDAFLASIRAMLDPDVFAALWSEGQALSAQQILSAIPA